MAVTSAPRLLALHGLRLKGIAEPEVIAATLDADVEPIREELVASAEAGLVTYRYGRIPGYLLTPHGREVGQRLLADELDRTGTRPAIESAYQDFLGVNGQLLAVCTAWQLRDDGGSTEVNDHTDQDYDTRVKERLARLHTAVDPILGQLGDTLARMSGHRRRLGNAVDKVLAGEHDYFTKPMFPSYHSAWFELHEDLLATLGTERSGENRAVRANEGSL